MAKRRYLAIALPFLVASTPLPAAESASVSVGKQRAAASKLEWEIREAGHPVLGTIRFAFLKTPVETPVGNAKVYSRAYFSCQKGLGKLAIELTNTATPDDPKGFPPNADPKLLCSRPIQPFDEKLVQEELLSNWDFNTIGDALARGFRPFPLRECVSIRVVQEVALPQGWAKKSQRVEFDIFPYSRDLDAIFATCGEKSAYAEPAAPVATAAKAPAPAAPVARPAAPAPAPPPQVVAKAPAPPPTPAPQQVAAAAAWQDARVIASGKTNVRAGPNLTSAIVVTLDPGTPILVQRTGTEWWRAKARSGAAFDGYIRQDRLEFR